MDRRRCTVEAKRKDGLTEQPEKVSVHVKYKNIEETFSGTTEETWLLLNKFFNELIPPLRIASNLWLSPDLERLAKDLEGIVAFSPEGPNLLLQKNKLTDNETLILWLLAGYMGNKLKLLPTDALSKEELQEKLGKSSKIASTRLGELVKTELVSKTPDDKFKITTFGVLQTQKETLPRIRAKTKT
jgi:hypothetical protein